MFNVFVCFCTVPGKMYHLVSCLIKTNIKKWLWSIPRKSLNGTPERGGPMGHLITIDFIHTMLWFGQLLQQHGPNDCAVSYSVVHYTWYMGILREYPPGQLCGKSIRFSYCISVTVWRAVYRWVVPFLRTNETLAGFPSLSAFYYIVSQFNSWQHKMLHALQYYRTICRPLKSI